MVKPCNWDQIIYGMQNIGVSGYGTSVRPVVVIVVTVSGCNINSSDHGSDWSSI